MLSWFRECLERYIESKFGKEIWQEISEQAPCAAARSTGKEKPKVEDDAVFFNLLEASSAVLRLPSDAILEGVGSFFMSFVRWEGFEFLLECQGRTLQEWLNNVNSLHQHVAQSFPNGLRMPVILCEDDDKDAFLLHFQSTRGSKLAPLLVGIVKEVASFQFHQEIDMKRLKTQGENGEQFTTWRVIPCKPYEVGKLYRSRSDKSSLLVMANNHSAGPLLDAAARLDESCESLNTLDKAERKRLDSISVMCDGFNENPAHDDIASPASVNFHIGNCADISISGSLAKSLFPYHVIVDQEFIVLQVGKDLPGILQIDSHTLVGLSLGKFLTITGPCRTVWNWDELVKLKDHTISVQSVNSSVKLKGTMVEISSGPRLQVLFMLSPDVKNVSDLKELNLTMSDLPFHSFQADAVLLGEHIECEVNAQRKLDQLSQALRKERDVTSALLYSLLPPSVANDLRDGRSVEPMYHDNITLVQVGMVRFDSFCRHASPLDMMVFLDQFYSVMDFLCCKFGLRKLESKEGIFLACNGLENDQPADDIANFAIAAMHCCGESLSTPDGHAVQFRVGIHTGQCLSGVVGMVSPRFCFFGETVETAKGIEKSSKPGRILCSSVAFGQISHFSLSETAQFRFAPRGFVEMRGSSDIFTYWLNGGTGDNLFCNTSALANLRTDVTKALSSMELSFTHFFGAPTQNSTDRR